MNGLRAIEILNSLLNAQMAATADELDELVAAELVVALNPWSLNDLAALRGLWESYGGRNRTDPNGMWNPGWLQIALQNLETKLRSDFHRAMTSDDKLARQERERAAMRGILGLLRDPDASALAQQAAHVQAVALPPNRPLLPCPPAPAPVYGVSLLGETAFLQLRARHATYGAVPLEGFLKPFRKAQSNIQQLSERVRSIDVGLGPVRKGRHQVVVGLIKSGLPAEQAVSAYHQAQQRVRQANTHPAEPPHLAVTLVRHAVETNNMALAEQRMQAAEQALLRRGLSAGPQTRGAAKSLLGFADLNMAAARLVDLCTCLRPLVGNDERLTRFASRLMPVRASPQQLVRRCQMAAQMLGQGGYPYDGRIEATAVALAATAADDTALGPLVFRYNDIRLRLLQTQLASVPTAVIPAALELTACPGSPEEAVSTAWALATQLSDGHRPNLETLELACSLAKRVAF